MQSDLSSVIQPIVSTAPLAIMAGNATYTGATVDRGLAPGFESLVFLIMSGVLTDATYTCTVYESDASNMSGETAVADADLIGQVNAFTFVAADDGLIKRVGYKGRKRYTRLKIVQSGATTGGFICALAILAGARILPITAA